MISQNAVFGSQASPMGFSVNSRFKLSGNGGKFSLERNERVKTDISPQFKPFDSHQYSSPIAINLQSNNFAMKPMLNQALSRESASSIQNKSLSSINTMVNINNNPNPINLNEVFKKSKDDRIPDKKIEESKYFPQQFSSFSHFQRPQSQSNYLTQPHSLTLLGESTNSPAKKTPVNPQDEEEHIFSMIKELKQSQWTDKDNLKVKTINHPLSFSGLYSTRVNQRTAAPPVKTETDAPVAKENKSTFDITTSFNKLLADKDKILFDHANKIIQLQRKLDSFTAAPRQPNTRLTTSVQTVIPPAAENEAFNEILLEQSKKIQELKERVDLLTEERQTLKSTLEAERNQKNSQQAEVMLANARMATELKNLRILTQTKEQESNSEIQFLQKRVKTLEDKYLSSLTAIKEKDTFIENYLLRKAKNEEIDDVRGFLAANEARMKAIFPHPEELN